MNILKEKDDFVAGLDTMAQDRLTFTQYSHTAHVY